MDNATTVPRLHRPSVEEFRSRFEKRRSPVVLTGVMDGWKAMQRWSPGYFAEHLPDAQLVVSTSDENLPDDGPITPELLNRMKIRNRRFYAPGGPLNPPLPMLIDDIEFPEYREVGSSASPRMWMGAGVIGPLHYDTTANLHGIVCGEKRFTLFHPRQLPLLYP